VKTLVMLPELSAVAEPRADVSKAMFTVSPDVKPDAVTVVFAVGGPTAGDTETEAAQAKLAELRTHTATKRAK
jgi:hypothetical protein